MKKQFCVLVIENPLGDRKASTQLENAGCYVLTASGCENALDKMPEYVDAVVIDAETPELCTQTALQQLKARAPRTGIVVLAGENMLSLVRGALRAEEYLTIPCMDQDLLPTLERCFLKSQKGFIAPERSALIFSRTSHAISIS
ncbi:hypothetical protein LWC08_02350 [Desulfobaculum bizertense]|uniref:hypothetical protein n=1 Tax=Desulfobaculum bizertense TaxID=376490 RepID=UPI001F21B664|nr:hypothetical protein [Desulfobaculum bizertense]UIJ38427.1 hypothetical protein LWC08_02350 [Desulfobaculum bizertense]